MIVVVYVPGGQVVLDWLRWACVLGTSWTWPCREVSAPTLPTCGSDQSSQPQSFLYMEFAVLLSGKYFDLGPLTH